MSNRRFWILYLLGVVAVSLGVRLALPSLGTGFFMFLGIVVVGLAPVAARLCGVRDPWGPWRSH